MMEIKITSVEKAGEAASRFVQAMDGRTVFAFYGPMGTGKTTFIKAVCETLGVADVVNSPTFAIVNEYWSERLDAPIYHFDFYRLNRISEATDMGAEEYFYSGHICMIEWPEVIEPLLPPNAVRVEVEECADGSRVVRL